MRTGTLGAQGVQLVEEDDARGLAAGRLEDVVDVLLGGTDPHVEDVGERDGEEVRAELARDGPGDEGLAAAGRAVQEQTAAQRLAVQPAQFGIAHGGEEGGLQAVLDLLHAADVGEAYGTGGVHVPGGGVPGGALAALGLRVLQEAGPDEVLDLLLGGGPVEGGGGGGVGRGGGLGRGLGLLDRRRLHRRGARLLN
ncbi:hypothetical protein AQF52_2780 [Streptomyces venezuelae]|nr:hypothetical protein AQF52_2780 [Streptomyces venezuelae]